MVDDLEKKLGAWIGRMNDLRALNVEAAKAAAPLIEASIRETAAAGEDADGKAWKPLKNGGKPLAHAAEHVTAVGDASTATFGGGASGVVRITVEGHDVFHQRGTKRVPRRAIITADKFGMPDRLAKIVRDACASVFARITGGGS